MSIKDLKIRFSGYERYAVRGCEKSGHDVTEYAGQVEGYSTLYVNWKIVDTTTDATIVALAGGSTKHLAHVLCDQMNAKGDKLYAADMGNLANKSDVLKALNDIEANLLTLMSEGLDGTNRDEERKRLFSMVTAINDADPETVRVADIIFASFQLEDFYKN